jgi:hypothetical protein
VTPTHNRNQALLSDPVRYRQISERIPAARWAEPQDFVGPVLFLASEASQYVCGELLVVDGVCPFFFFSFFLFFLFFRDGVFMILFIGLDGSIKDLFFF